MTAPIATDHRPASWRGTLVMLALLYLAAQAVFATHGVEHLLHGDPAPCEVCDLGSAPALPTVAPALAAPIVHAIPEVREQLPQHPFARVQRVHLPRAPPL